MEKQLVQKFISIMLVFSYRCPTILNLIAIGFTALCWICVIRFVQSDFTDLIYFVLTVPCSIGIVITLYFIFNKNLVANYQLTQHFIKHQDLTASDDEIAFFLREAESEGFKSEFEHYLDSLGRKPLIKECLSKCLALQDKKNSGGIKA